MGGKEVITLKQVLAHMAETIEPFGLRYVKLNEQKGTGGEVVEVSGQLLSGRGKAKAPGAPLAMAIDLGSQPSVAVHQVRNPNHFDNMTRNLVSTLNGNYSKVHIYLILEFNGKKVII